MPCVIPSSPIACCVSWLKRRVPSCLIRLAITRHASRDVIVQIAPLIVSFYCFSSPFAPFIDTIGGEATLLAHRAAAL